MRIGFFTLVLFVPACIRDFPDYPDVESSLSNNSSTEFIVTSSLSLPTTLSSSTTFDENTTLGYTSSIDNSTGFLSSSTSTSETFNSSSSTTDTNTCSNNILDNDEFCDDGNTIDYDGCPSTCQYDHLITFLTTIEVNGNINGLSGADTICSEQAIENNLYGSYKAWLSDSTITAKQRFENNADLPVYLRTGNQVTEKFSDIYSGGLLNPISIDASGEIYLGYTWTNTTFDGEIKSVNGSCDNWTNDSLDFNGRYGYSAYKNETWTDSPNDEDTMNCSEQNRLYCFQVVVE